MPSRYAPQDEFERGAIALFKAFNRYMNQHELSTVAFDSQLTILWPFLRRHRLATIDTPPRD